MIEKYLIEMETQNFVLTKQELIDISQLINMYDSKNDLLLKSNTEGSFSVTSNNKKISIQKLPTNKQ